MESCSYKWLKNLKNKTVWTFSTADSSADFYASNIKMMDQTVFTLHTPIGESEISLPLVGEHNISNAIAASALAISVGASLTQVKNGLAASKPVKGRLYPVRLNQTQLIWDDCYNANVGSMSAAIHVLATQPGYKVLVVGDMAELGNDANIYHQQIGELAKQQNIDCVVSVGQLSELISQFSGVGHHFIDKQSAVDYLLNLLRLHPTLTMLVKGSRSAKMEDLIVEIQTKIGQD